MNNWKQFGRKLKKRLGKSQNKKHWKCIIKISVTLKTKIWAKNSLAFSFRKSFLFFTNQKKNRNYFVHASHPDDDNNHLTGRSFVHIIFFADVSCLHKTFSIRGISTWHYRQLVRYVFIENAGSVDRVLLFWTKPTQKKLKWATIKCGKTVQSMDLCLESLKWHSFGWLSIDGNLNFIAVTLLFVICKTSTWHMITVVIRFKDILYRKRCAIHKVLNETYRANKKEPNASHMNLLLRISDLFCKIFCKNLFWLKKFKKMLLPETPILISIALNAQSKKTNTNIYKTDKCKNYIPDIWFVYKETER